MRRLAFRLAIASFAAIAPLWAHADDQQIAQAIASRLKQEKAAGHLRGFDIDLQVRSGEVCLKGFVTSDEQQLLAEESARGIEGVTNVVNELQVRDGKNSEASVESKNVLAGFSERSKKNSKATSNAAYNAKSEESQLKPVVIDNSANSTSSDDETSEIADKVIREIEKLKKSGKLKGFGIDVDVEDGVVTLTGKVSSLEQQHLVIERIRKIDGVEKVVNDLKITGANGVRKASAPAELPEAAEKSKPKTASNKDEGDASQIVQEIVRRLEEKRDEGLLRGFDVDVRCDSGSVLLTGTVPTAEQQATVLDVARRVNGVKRVVNNLTLAGQQIPAQYVAAPMAGMPAQVAPMQANANQVPLAFAPSQSANYNGLVASQVGPDGSPVPMQTVGYGIAPARFDHPQMPGYAWPSYASHPNYAAVTYPRQYSATAWPYIGPFYPYPQVPLGWRKVSLEWKDGFWHLDFKDRH